MSKPQNKDSLSQLCTMSPNQPDFCLILMKFMIHPSVFSNPLTAYNAFGQVLWHELANLVPRAKFPLCSLSLHGNLTSATLTALSSCSARVFQPLQLFSLNIIFLFSVFLNAHIPLFLNHNPFKELSITHQQQMEQQGGPNV